MLRSTGKKKRTLVLSGATVMLAASKLVAHATAERRYTFSEDASVAQNLQR